MGARSRRKGGTGEREFVNRLKEAGCTKVERNLKQSRNGGCDIEYDRFNIEVKRRNAITVHQWMEQAVSSLIAVGQDGLPATIPGRIPVVAMRGDGKDWLVTFRLQDVLQMLPSIMARIDDRSNAGTDEAGSQDPAAIGRP